MRKPIQLLVAALFGLQAIAVSADYQIKHLEPAFWWAGMKNRQLQLLVHGDRIADLVPSLDYTGVSIKEVTRVENPNYLFVDLELAKDVKPGEFTIQFHKAGKTKISYPYRLESRAAGSAQRDSFNPSDVIYLITPDRFANGDRGNDSISGLMDSYNRTHKDGRHGGDIQGVINHLDYISDMGFTQIWLNPVLQNNQPHASYHGYAITDFYQVDARYGSNKLYRKLSEKAKARGLGLIMDMVLNHSGSEHWWMKDLPAKDWINFGGEFVPTTHKRESLHDPHGIDSDRQQFSDGWFVPSMPDLNQKNPLMATYLIQNSIWWVEFAGLSGIRLDTYSYPDRQFLAEWTRRLTEEYPKLNIVGEEWSLNPAIVAYWQRGKNNHDGYVSHLPSLMDFPLQNAVVEGLSEEERWDSGLRKIYDSLASDFLYADPYNLVVFPDNHDMSRIYTQLNENFASYKMAIAYFLTTRGIPQVFYGTEILMSNPGTEDHGIIRTDFPGGWSGDPVNAFTGEGLSARQREAQAFSRKLLNWRKKAPAIHRGKLTHYSPEEGTYTYFRHDGSHKVMVVFNKNASAKRLRLDRFREVLKDTRSGRDILSGESVDLVGELELPPHSVRIIEAG